MVNRNIFDINRGNYCVAFWTFSHFISPIIIFCVTKVMGEANINIQTIIKKQEQLSILIDKIEESVGNIFNDVSKLYINMTNPKDIQ